MYVCVHVCVCIYVCMYVCMYVFFHVKSELLTWINLSPLYERPMHTPQVCPVPDRSFRSRYKITLRFCDSSWLHDSRRKQWLSSSTMQEMSPQLAFDQTVLGPVRVCALSESVQTILVPPLGPYIICPYLTEPSTNSRACQVSFSNPKSVWWSWPQLLPVKPTFKPSDCGWQ